MLIMSVVYKFEQTVNIYINNDSLMGLKFGKSHKEIILVQEG